jgi:hypothetical protein
VASNQPAVRVPRRSGGDCRPRLSWSGWTTREGGHLICFGRWVQIDGTAQIVSLPDAMDGLVDDYRRIRGEHPDWDDYRRAMQDQQRVLVRVSIDAAGPADAR